MPFIYLEVHSPFPSPPPSQATKVGKKALRDTCRLQNYPRVAWLAHLKPISHTRNLPAPWAFHLSKGFISSPIFFFVMIIIFGSILVVQDQCRNFPLATDSKKKRQATCAIRINESWNLCWWKCRIQRVEKKFQVSHGFIVTIPFTF